MADQKTNEVKPEGDIDTEDVDVDSTEDTDDVISPEGEKDTQSESSTDENQQESEEDVESEESQDTTEDTSTEVEPEGLQTDEKFPIKRIPGETPKEFALRMEVWRVKEGRRKERSSQLFNKKDETITPNIEVVLSEDDKQLLSKYNPEEINNFEQILGVVAKKQGWVKRGEISTMTYQDKGQDILDSFLKDHPEYSVDHDPDGILWNRFKEEFSLYKRPNNPNDLKKIFNKVHREIFDIQSVDGLKTINAQKEKLKVASHSGATPNRTVSSPQQSSLDPSLKKHMKGFDEGELEEIFGG